VTRDKCTNCRKYQRQNWGFHKLIKEINGFISFTMPIKDKHFDSHSLLKFLRNKTFIDYRKVNCQFKLTIMASKRKFLTLEERVKVISLLGKGHSCRRVASDLGVGKTQIQSILKRKHEIMDEFEENVNCESKRPKRESEFASVMCLSNIGWTLVSSRVK